VENGAVRAGSRVLTAGSFQTSSQHWAGLMSHLSYNIIPFLDRFYPFKPHSSIAVWERKGAMMMAVIISGATSLLKIFRAGMHSHLCVAKESMICADFQRCSIRALPLPSSSASGLGFHVPFIMALLACISRNWSHAHHTSKPSPSL